ncbi:MAG: DUF4154 domain-containing protein [Pseudomonadales bacterium]|nr:DUF4154 domain-containing protein [Pseudomonadales bacterium]
MRKWIVLLSFLIFLLSPAASSKKLNPEQIQVALILELIRYIEWPEQAKLNSINVAVLGIDKRLEQEFLQAFKHVKVHGRTLQLYKINPHDSVDGQKIQVIYIGPSGIDRVSELARKLRRTDTLLITKGSSLRRDFMLNITHPQGKHLSFEINRSNIIFEHLKIDNKIMLLGGSELDVAELFRETQQGLDGLKAELLNKEKALVRLASEVKEKKTDLHQKNQLLQAKESALQEKNQQISSGQQQLNRLSTELGQAESQLFIKQQSLKNSQELLDSRLQNLQEKEQKLSSLSAIIQHNKQTLYQQNLAMEIQVSEINEKTKRIGRQHFILLFGAALLSLCMIFLLTILWVNRARKAALIAAENARNEAEKANQAKSLFLAKMSHEIRTPMSGVLGMSTLLNELNLNKEQQQCNDVIHVSGQTLLSVINDILDYSKIEAGKLQLECISFSIEAVIWEVMKMFRIQAQEKNLPLMADIDPNLSTYVIGDPSRLRQILINLIGNAFKFTSTGEILICVQAASHVKDLIQFSVYDSGIGLSHEQQKNLFSAFTQGDSSTTRKHGGTGLGLAICKQLAELMGGSIQMESEEGRGSHFWVELNLKADNEAAEKQTIRGNHLNGRKIIIIDDNATYRSLLEKFSQRVGVQVESFASGENLCDFLIHSQQQGLSYDLLITDLNMPKYDGMQLSRQLSQCQSLKPIPIILMTASSIPPDIEEIKNTLIVKAVEKPLVEKEFIALLDDVFNAIPASTEAPDNSKTLIQHMAKKISLPLKILVAEDNAVIRKVMAGILNKCHQKAEFAENGQQAVDMFKAQDTAYDVIFMDCEMPEMDGLTASREIRQWEKQQQRAPTKIIALTAHVLPEQVIKCKDSGMDEFMIKPIDINALLQMLEEIADRKRIL